MNLKILLKMLTHEGDNAMECTASPVRTNEMTTDDITRDGTNATPTLILGRGTSKNPDQR